MWALASNTEYEDGIPVIIEYPEDYPFEAGERERDWHEASDEEYGAYVAHYMKEN